MTILSISSLTTDSTFHLCFLENPKLYNILTIVKKCFLGSTCIVNLPYQLNNYQYWMGFKYFFDVVNNVMIILTLEMVVMLMWYLKFLIKEEMWCHAVQRGAWYLFSMLYSIHLVSLLLSFSTKLVWFPDKWLLWQHPYSYLFMTATHKKTLLQAFNSEFL